MNPSWNALRIMLHLKLVNDILLLESIFSSWMILASQIFGGQAAGKHCHLQVLVSKSRKLTSGTSVICYLL